ncbi:MAG: peptide chain release factor-like protein [Candidatus Omnitrophota bacterium]
MVMRLKDLRIEYYKSSGPGGQHKNKRCTAVRVTHILTGLCAVGQQERSQAMNKALALARLEKKITAANRRKKPRVPTRTPRAVKERILEWKKKRKAKKQARSRAGILKEI